MLRAFSLVLLASLLLSPVGMRPAAGAVPVAPILSGPTTGSTITVNEAPPVAVPEFSWYPVTGATRYRIQISANSGFTTTVVEATTVNTVYTPDSYNAGEFYKFSDGLYYWRVRVDAPVIGDYSDQWSFNKLWGSPDNAPNLISPADYATLDFYDAPAFSWSPVTGAAYYILQIYTASHGWDASTTLKYDTLATTFQPKAKLVNASYFWRVVPYDYGDHAGMASNEGHFTAGYNPTLTLLTPDPTVITYPTFTPTFRWTAVRGAEKYRLQYATDEAFTANLVTVNTYSTSYTPERALKNDQDYWWRVCTYSGVSVASCVQASHPFRKRWYITPVLLTPTPSYPDARLPYFSWTPVPGAAYYIVELDPDPGFTPPVYITSAKITNTYFTPPSNYYGDYETWSWRVTPYDGNDNPGAATVGSYVSYYWSVTPELAYPLYYYPPDIYAGFPDVHMNPYEDRTVAFPVFTWHRVLKPAFDDDEGDEYAEAYELQVSTNSTFSGINWADTVHNWTAITENTTAAPSTAHPFTPENGTTYYWRVRCLVDGSPVSNWSQKWVTRFDSSLKLPATSAPAPQLLRPTNGYEYAESTPLLEWFPKQSAASYEVQISQDSSFASLADSGTVSNPAYIPTISLGRRSLGDLDFPVYYWRARAAGGTWSETRHFQVAAQSRWEVSRDLGAMDEPSVLATDPAGDVGVSNIDYDLTDLKVLQTRAYWYYGFHVPAAPTHNVIYAFYLDLNQVSGSGATSDALGYKFTATPAHLPEYAIYVYQQAGSFSASNVYIYHWLGSSWGVGQTLQSLGGSLAKTGTYVEIKGPNSAIGFNPIGFTPPVSSYYISLMSLTTVTTDTPKDTVPSGNTNPVTGFVKVVLGDTYQIGSDPAASNGDATSDTDYDLTDLYASETMNFWSFGFHIPATPGKDVTYALYLDTDHVEGSGGTVDPLGYTISTPSGYRPEYVIYILQESGLYLPANTYLYHWNGSAWDPRNTLEEISGGIESFINDCNDYVEVQISSNALGSVLTNPYASSFTVSLVSLPAGGIGMPQDSVPSDPNIPSGGLISRFSSVTERMNVVTPPNSPDEDPTTYSSVPWFSWDYPILTPYSGYIVTTWTDSTSSEVLTYNWKCADCTGWAPLAQYWPRDFVGDTTYYWKVRPNYYPAGMYSGLWNQGTWLVRRGFIAQNLQASVTFATPTLSWDTVEGAAWYELQVATVSNFGSGLVVDLQGASAPRQNSYTPSSLTLAGNTTYFWRVRVVRGGGTNVTSEWTVPDPACPAPGHSGCFTLTLPVPTGLTHQPSGVVGRAPTLCWTPLIMNAPVGDPFAGTPFFAAFKYRVQVATNESFSGLNQPIESIDTEQSCYTPQIGYADRDLYYWRVAAFDGYGKMSSFSAAQTFAKQYPVTTLVSPADGGNIGLIPTFVWTPVVGASRYRILVSKFSNFSSLVDDVITVNTRYTSTKLYSSNPPNYWWKVVIIDDDNNYGPYNDATLIYDPYPYDVFLPLLKK